MTFTPEQIERLRELLAEAIEVTALGPADRALVGQHLARGDVRGAQALMLRALGAAVAEELDLALDEV